MGNSEALPTAQTLRLLPTRSGYWALLIFLLLFNHVLPPSFALASEGFPRAFP